MNGEDKGSGAAIVRQEAQESWLSIQDTKRQLDHVHGVMKQVMVEGEDYGTIPGCAKPCLLKAGAEKLSLTFRLVPRYTGEREPVELGNGHREYVIHCSLFNSQGDALGEGLGSCSTMESKYRYRTGPRESTGKPVPKEYWDKRNSDPKGAQELLGGKGFCVHKGESGVWEVCVQGEKVENPDIADQYNTVLKMAKKRAYVDAVLTRTAASAIFTQDIDDRDEKTAEGETKNPTMQMPSEKPKAAPAPAAPSSPPAATAPKGGTANDKQKNYIKKLAKDVGLEDDAQRHALTAQLCNGKTSTNDLTIGEASTLIDTLLAVKNGKAELIFKPDGTPAIDMGGGAK
jgi:hypothetical protein